MLEQLSTFKMNNHLLKNVITIFILMACCLNCFSKPSTKLSENDKMTIHNIIDELLANEFQDLDREDIKFKLKFYSGKDYFFYSNFRAKRIFGKHRYVLGVNPVIFDKGIPIDALKGIMAHELMHTRDYVNIKTVFGLMNIGRKMLSTKTRSKYESGTDLKVIHIGLGAELKSYRIWLKSILNKKQLKKKFKIYMSPEEIQEEMDRLENLSYLNLIEKYPTYITSHSCH